MVVVKNKALWILASLAFALTCTILLLRIIPQPTPDQVAISSTKCLASLDENCLWHHMSEREKVNSGLSREQFNRIVEKIRSTTGTPTSSEPVTIEHYTQQSSGGTTMRTETGRAFSVGLVVEHGRKPHVCGVIGNLVMIPFVSERVDGKPVRSKIKSTRMSIEYGERELALLGLTGIPLGANYRLVSWEELRDVYSKMKGWDD